ncbi:MAG: glycosyltransferase family 4 protein [Gemmatimonadales bacterium]
MRLTLVTDTFRPEVNGVTTVLATMRSGLLARGHAVQVIAPDYGSSDVDPEGEVHRVPSIPCPTYAAVRLSWPLGRGIGTLMSRFAPDVVHVVTEGPLGAFARRRALRMGWPLVTSFHTDFPSYAARYLGGWAVAPTRRYLRWFHGPARATQTPSEIACAELRRLGVARPTVWGRAVDCRLFSPSRRDEARRRRLGATDRTLVLHVGRIAVEKDVATLIAAFRQAHETLGDRAAFCVAGEGPEEPRLRRALPFASHLGFLGRDRLADLYADADLFVFTSPTETCGLVVLEAMASGLPVLAANAGGVRDNVRDGITGRLLPPGQADACMGQAARAFATARDWQRELDALVVQYEAVRAPAA